MHVTRVALVVSACVLHLATAEEWIRVLSCSPDSAGAIYDLPNGNADLFELATMATKIKFCAIGDSNDCVTSQPNSFPVLNLRQGFAGMQTVGGEVPCDTACVQEFWTGSEQRLAQLRAGCLGGLGPVNVYQTCGNVRGVHISPWLCTWDWQCQVCVDPNCPPAEECAQARNLEMYINQVTYSPTSSPTGMPSRFYQHPELLTNVTELQDYVAGLEQRFEGRFTQSENALRQEIQTLSDRVVLLEEAVAVGQVETLTNITALQANISTMVGAFRTALQPSPPSPRVSANQVESQGSSVVVGAIGSIRLASGTCAVDNVCELNDYVKRLQAALNQTLGL